MVKYEKLSDIKGDFVGYIWMSDESKPEKINGFKDFSVLSKNSFLIEANIFAKDKSHSVSVEFVGGEYIINTTDWTECEKEKQAKAIKYTETDYLAHKIDGVSKIRFRQVWRAEKDEDCNNFEVLKPAERAFVGFDNKEEVCND